LQVTTELSLVIQQSGLCALSSIERKSEYQAYTKSKPNQSRPNQTYTKSKPNQPRTRPNQIRPDRTRPSRIPRAPIPKRNAAPSAGGPRQEEHHLHANSPQTHANTQGHQAPRQHKPHPRNPRKPEGARNHARTWEIELGVTILGKGATLNPNAFSKLTVPSPKPALLRSLTPTRQTLDLHRHIPFASESSITPTRQTLDLHHHIPFASERRMRNELFKKFVC
jgi:hypothetical protein